MRFTRPVCSIVITTLLAVVVAGTVLAGEEDAILVEAGQVSRVRENLDRGIVALQRTDETVYVGWRLLGKDPADIVFDVYRVKWSRCAVKRFVVPAGESPVPAKVVPAG